MDTPQHVLTPGRFFDVFFFIVIPGLALYGCRELAPDSAILPVGASLLMLPVGLRSLFVSRLPKARADVPRASSLLPVLAVLVGFCGMLEMIGFYADAFLLTLFFWVYGSDHRAGPGLSRLLHGCAAGLGVSAFLYCFLAWGLQLTMPEGLLSFPR